MAEPEKTVFISYRRQDISWALAVYQDLTAHGYDVFFDYKSIKSGDFEQIILSNIKARAHFLVLLTPTALDRSNKPGDWLRREIETAIDEKRNIIPLFFEGFKFSSRFVSRKLTGKLAKLKSYNGLEVPSTYFSEAMEKLRKEFLNVTLDAVIQPVSDEVQKMVKEQQEAANEALLQPEIQELLLVKDRFKKWGKESWSGVRKTGRNLIQNANPITFSLIGVALLALLGLFIGRNYILDYLSKPDLPGGTNPPLMTSFEAEEVKPTVTVTHTGPPSDTPQPAPTFQATPTPLPGLGSTMVSETDGMTLVYVPAGEFQMGNDTGEADERPVHSVNLDAYWIDQTEVTNAMYTNCVTDGNCEPPFSSKSSMRESYYGNPEFDHYPVIYVTWNGANAYCEWAGRRLPSEAEWEKAAGWDDEKRTQRLYPWGNTPFDGSKANFCDTNCKRDSSYKNPEYDDGYADTAPVGNYPAGASFYGTRDMAGNVWEWVTDWYDVYPGGDRAASEYFGQTYRVVRGSSWFFRGENARTTNRAPQDPAQSNDAIGFRCALSAAE